MSVVDVACKLARFSRHFELVDVSFDVESSKADILQFCEDWIG